MTTGQEGRIDWFNKDRVLELIGYWKESECLYNINHKDYFKKDSRLEALETITRKLQISIPQITSSDVKYKINSLRSQYCREMHKYLKAKKKGTEHDVYSNWAYWFDSMSFLKSFVKVRDYQLKRGQINDTYYLSNTSTDEVSIDEMPRPIKRSKSSEISPSSTDPTDDSSMYLYNPDPDILDLFHKQVVTVTSSQPTTSSQSKINTQAATVSQPSTSLHPTTSDNITTEYDDTFMKFIKVNLAMVTDISLKDELLEKITMLLLEYKGKQRKADSL